MAFADNQGSRGIIDAAVGDRPVTVITAEAVQKGDVLGYSSGWKRALATTGGVIQGRVVALDDAASGAYVPIATHCVVNGYTGATTGGYVYVDEGTAYGKVTQTAPSTAGDSTVIVGVALSKTEVMFFLNSRADAVSGG